MVSIVARLAAALLAVASAIPLWFAAWTAVLSGLVAAQDPDPSVADGDPCCGHPDTWGEVAIGLVWAALLTLACVALSYLAVRLLRFAASGRRPTRTQAKGVVLLAAYVIVITLGFVEY